MKIIWNNKKTNDSTEESSTGHIALPKPTGNWISEETSSYFEEAENKDKTRSLRAKQFYEVTWLNQKQICESL